MNDKNGLILNVDDFIVISVMPEDLLNYLLLEDRHKLNKFVNKPLKIVEIYPNEVYNLEILIQDKKDCAWIFVKSNIVEKYEKILK